MTTPSNGPYVDPHDLTDGELAVYEAIATLEQRGHPPSGAEITAATSLSGETVATVLRALVGKEVAVHSGEGYTLARHDWSSVPDLPAHGQPPVPEPRLNP
jgi:biotin operon repressor